MKKLINWFKGQTTQARVMMIFIVIIVIFIITRWAWISGEVSGSFRNIFAPEQTEQPTDHTPSEQPGRLPESGRQPSAAQPEKLEPAHPVIPPDSLE